MESLAVKKAVIRSGIIVKDIEITSNQSNLVDK